MRSNAFYLRGGETLKIGRVVVKVVEINTEREVDDVSDNKTEMSLGEIQIDAVAEEAKDE
jgi:hypothetical protein